MPKTCSLRGAAVDAILIQQRTEIPATSVLNNYLERMGHVNATEDAPVAHCALHLARCLFACGNPCRGMRTVIHD